MELKYPSVLTTSKRLSKKGIDNTEKLLEVKTDAIDRTDGLKVDDKEKLEE